MFPMDHFVQRFVLWIVDYSYKQIFIYIYLHKIYYKIRLKNVIKPEISLLRNILTTPIPFLNVEIPYLQKVSSHFLKFLVHV